MRKSSSRTPSKRSAGRSACSFARRAACVSVSLRAYADGIAVSSAERAACGGGARRGARERASVSHSPRRMLVWLGAGAGALRGCVTNRARLVGLPDEREVGEEAVAPGNDPVVDEVLVDELAHDGGLAVEHLGEAAGGRGWGKGRDWGAGGEDRTQGETSKESLGVGWAARLGDEEEDDVRVDGLLRERRGPARAEAEARLSLSLHLHPHFTTLPTLKAPARAPPGTTRLCSGSG